MVNLASRYTIKPYSNTNKETLTMDRWKSLVKVSEATRALARRFVASPLHMTIKLLGIILLVQIALGAVTELVGIGSGRFALNPIEWSLMLMIAWVLLSGQIARIFTGLFLLFVFSFSIGFLIFPIDQVASVVRTALGADEKVIGNIEREFSSVESQIWYAQYRLQELEKKSDKNAKELKLIYGDLDSARRTLKETTQKSLAIVKETGGGDGKPEAWVRQLVEATEYFLRIGAPFIFSMLMGALGSSIMITQQFITNYTSKPPAWYLYRLIQGMTISLLIVYGLAAGILSLGGQQQPIDTEHFEQNKFFIGFISALAGLFSEHAFAKLQDVSRTLFGIADKSQKNDSSEASQTKKAKSKQRQGNDQ
jgi:hypothetical protein